MTVLDQVQLLARRPKLAIRRRLLMYSFDVYAIDTFQRELDYLDRRATGIADIQFVDELKSYLKTRIKELKEKHGINA